MSDYSADLYLQQLQEKRDRTLQQFAELGVCDLEVFPSPAQHYRMRAEFKVWHQDNQVHYAMFRADKSRQVYTVEDYPPGSPAIQALMPALRAALNADECLRRKLFQLEFLTTSTGDALVTLIYHRPLDDAWREQAEKLADRLNIHVVGRSRKQKIVLGRDHVLEKFQVGQQLFEYQQLEGSFTQPNASICADMLNWAVRQSAEFGGDLLELYCGNGNFTLPLSRNFGKVLATEVAKPGIQSALDNCQRNQVDNIAFVRMSSEDISGALNQVRSFERLKHIDLADYEFTTIFVDPPRAGLDPATLSLLQKFTHIMYISCNPDTLADNLRTLMPTHRITRMALFDQFPFTEHRECGVILRRR